MHVVEEDKELDMMDLRKALQHSYASTLEVFHMANKDVDLAQSNYFVFCDYIQAIGPQMNQNMKCDLNSNQIKKKIVEFMKKIKKQNDIAVYNSR